MTGMEITESQWKAFADGCSSCSCLV